MFRGLKNQMNDIHKSPYRWVLLAGLWFIYFSFGVVAASMAPLVEPISSDLEIDYAQMGLIFGAWPLVYIVSAIPCGALLDTVRPRTALLLAACVIALSSVARALADGELSMFLAVALFGIGGPLISVGAPKFVAQWFEGSSRGLAVGIYLTGPALGNAAALAMTNSVVMPWAGGSWRIVMFLYGALAISSGLFWLLVASNPILNVSATEQKAARKGGSMNTRAVFQLLSLPSVRLLLAMGTCIFFVNHATNNWLPEILRRGGFSAVEAGTWSAVPAMVGIASSLLIPRFAVPSRRFDVAAALFVALTASALMLQYLQGNGLVVALFLLGIARGSMVAVVMLILMDTPNLPRDQLGRAGGLFFVAAEIGGVLGPVTFGFLSSDGSGFSSSLLLLAAAGAGLLLMNAFLARIQLNTAKGGQRA